MAPQLRILFLYVHCSIYIFFCCLPKREKRVVESRRSGRVARRLSRRRSRFLLFYFALISVLSGPALRRTEAFSSIKYVINRPDGAARDEDGMSISGWDYGITITL